MSENLTPAVAGTSLINFMAAKHGLEPSKFLGTLIKTVFPAPKGPNDPPPSNEQVAAFLVVAKQYDLNPFIKEIYAFPAKGGGIVPIVSIDGWSTLINRQPNLDGLEFDDKFDDQGKLYAITAVIYNKNRSHPTRITEYMSECVRNTEPWIKWPARMLRHKALIQCARIAFGLAGIYDQDEGERIAETDGQLGNVENVHTASQTKSERLAEKIKSTQSTKTAASAPVVTTSTATVEEVIEVCGSCGATNVSLVDAEGVMLCDNCKPKPAPVVQEVKPAAATPVAATASVATAPATPPWARPKPSAAPTAVQSAPVTAPAGALSLEDQVAEMATSATKPRVKPKHPIIKRVQMPEFVDRTTPEDAWTQEQYNRAVAAVKKIPGANVEDAERQLYNTVNAEDGTGWIGLPIEQINAATLEVLIGLLENFANPEALKAWASGLGIWTGE